MSPFFNIFFIAKEINKNAVRDILLNKIKKKNKENATVEFGMYL